MSNSLEKLIKHLKKLISILEQEKSTDIMLFGLFKTTELSNGWDVVFSADWLKSTKFESHTYEDVEVIGNKIKEKKIFDNETLLLINRFVPVAPDSQFVQMCLTKLNVKLEDEPEFISPFAFNTGLGVNISEAIIIVCQNINKIQLQKNSYYQSIK